MITADACSEAVRAYDAQGIHRTGTRVDADSAEWLVQELAARGVEGVIEEHPFLRTDPSDCDVAIGAWKVAGYPLLDSVLPRPGTTIEGVVCGEPGQGRIAIVQTDGHGQTSTIDPLRSQPWAAIVAAVHGASGGLTLRNVWEFGQPHGPPVIQVPGEAWEALVRARDGGAAATIRCGASTTETSAANVIARVAGADAGLAPIAVLTPRSGWWHCAGERGGGIAIWLEVARAVRALALQRSIDFVATTGHELGFWGIERYCERHPGAAAAAMCWVHLGANIGAKGTATVVRSATQRLLDALGAADGNLGESRVGPTCELRPKPAGGEAQVIAAHGAAYVSMVGAGFSLFHSSTDRWPVAIDAEAIARNARLVLQFIRRFEPAAS
ncbi:MAG: M28 family peptidase [Dehalococcoidia bacterium]|uniref:M28 family peptidase n=1 Tax=Candidatus Amarobacter glycogenicus TaxID=3140699 RepID=UPI003137148F|nr:M28 family peptidase [Dehalococcoidia bacterium]